MHKSFWTSREAGFLTDGEVGYDNSSRVEPKRSHQWFMDTTEPELFSNKKQAIEASSDRQALASSQNYISPWHNASSFQSIPGQFNDQFFGSDSLGTVNMDDRNIDSDASGNISLNVERRKEFGNQYGSSPSMGLSMSHSLEDPSAGISFGGIRKVRVNQVSDSSDDFPASIGHLYGRGDNKVISMGDSYNKEDSGTMSLGPTYNNREKNTVSGDMFISIGKSFNKDGLNFMSIGHDYNKGDDNILSMGQPFDKEVANFITIGSSYEKEDSNVTSLTSSFSKGQEDFISICPAYDKPNENFISIGPSYCKGDDNSIAPVGSSYDKANSNITSLCSAQDKRDLNILSVGHNYNKDESNTMSFGAFHDDSEQNPSSDIISAYDVLVGDPNLAQTSEGQKDIVQTNTDSSAFNTSKATSKTDVTTKNKDAKSDKKVAPNNFPSNVKSLLSTGMLDGVPVKYVSWSREKNLRGIIKNTGYLCGCQECNFSKALNAYEFERHANCKTKHPNNHIYFENGKTIYAVVQELKNTPQDMLFDAIQSVTGSPINQKNFRSWKASYQAATRELQRIYGKDEIPMLS